MNSAIRWCRSGLVWVVAAVLCACGGGGGSGGGGSSGGGGGGGGGGGSPPYIIGTLISFPTGAEPPNFVSGSFNTGALVEVHTQSGGPAITNAVVKVNGTTLAYEPSYQDYYGELNVDPGAAVTATVQVNGTTYTASGSQVSAYPTITAPAPTTTWSVQSPNQVSWSGTAPSTTAQYASGVLDSNGALIWPTNGNLLLLDTSQQSYKIDANALTPGNQLVLVGLVDLLTLTGAASGSGFVVGGFNYAPVTVVQSIATLQSIAITPGAITVGLGKSVQLTARGTYSDGSVRDLTAVASWSTTDASKVAVNASGNVSGIASGSATITAQYQGVSVDTTIAVFAPNPSPSPPLSQSVTYQIDYAHSGRATVGANGPTFPPSAGWSVTLNGRISYPLIADGKVFVLTNVNSASATDDGTSLYALDEATGSVVWGPVAIPGLYHTAGHAYDHGKIFVVNFDGLLRSFDAATGAPGWTQQLPRSLLAPPMAVNGIVYDGGGGFLSAVDESNGNILTKSQVMNGDISSPTFSGDGVFVSYPCQVYKFDTLLNTLLWHYDGGCEGGGGSTAAYAGGRLYVRDNPSIPPGRVFDAATGNLLGSFNARPIPAFSADRGFFLTVDDNGLGTLTATDLTAQNAQWTFTGDGHLVSAPIVIDNTVVIGSSSGTVYALASSNGNVLWSGSAGGQIYGPDDLQVLIPPPGLGVGDGYLVVPAGNVLTAWRVAP
jgi:outer membrane protein assembly factor BamB